MKHIKKFENKTTIFTIYTIEGENTPDTTMAFYIDDKLEMSGEYGDSIYETIDGFIKGVKWSGVKFEETYINCEKYEIGHDIIYQTGIPESLNELESIINGKDMGLL